MLQERLDPPGPPSGILGGILILACGIFSIAVVAHHPTVHTHTRTQILQQVTAVAPMDELVHGTLILFMLALSYGFIVFALRRGMDRQTSIAGLLLYLAGAAAVIGAALIDGFFTPMLAGPNVHASGAGLSAILAVLAGGAVAIQILSKFGFAAFSLAIAFWSAGLLRAPGLVRYAAIPGLIAAAVPVAIMLFGPRYLNPASVTWIVLSQAVWYVTVGAFMVRREL